MMILRPPGLLIKARRHLKGFSQASLSELTGLTRARISDIERGRGLPTPDESNRLCECLELSPSRLLSVENGKSKPNLPALRRHLNPWAPFKVTKERETEKRWWSALGKCGAFLRQAERTLSKRNDFKWIQLYFAEARFDSYLELLASVHLLLDGAKPGWVAPQCCGFDQLPIIDPATQRIIGHRAHPSLEWRDVILIPQVTLKCAFPVRLDFLAGYRGTKVTHWLDVEFDGEGHDPTNDYRNEEAHRLPTIRFNTAQVRGGAFLAELGQVRRAS